MLSVKGVCGNGEVKLLENIPDTKRVKAIVTILDNDESNQEDIDSDLFDDLVDVISVCEDGAVNHNKY